MTIIRTAGHPDLDAFTARGFNAWLLWAKSATDCGSTLTQDCILQKAGAYDAWTAGGLYAPVSTHPGHAPTNCLLVMRLTTSGFVYDQKVTQPNNYPVQLRRQQPHRHQELRHLVLAKVSRPPGRAAAKRSSG